MMRSAVETGSLANGTETTAEVVGGGGGEVDIQKRWKSVLLVHGGGNSGDIRKRRILWKRGRRRWRLVTA